MQRKFGLDLIRTLAITLVLISHSSFFLASNWPETENLLWAGFWGVELFFVLSGYLIGGIIIREMRRNVFNVVSFWKRRWYRTLPAYYFFLAVNVIFFHLLNNELPDFKLYSFFLQNFAWKHPDFFPEAWSLAVEEFFYLLFPVVIYALNKFIKNWEKSFIVTGLAILFFFTAYRIIYVMESDPLWDDGVRKIVLCRLDSIMYGIGLALILDKFGRFINNEKYLFVGLTILIVSIIIFFGVDRDINIFSKTFLFSITSLGFACCFPYFVNLDRSKFPFVNKFIANFAAWSYSIYLSNLLSLSITKIYLEPRMDSDTLSRMILLAFFVLLTVSISICSYRFIETPFLRFRDRRQALKLAN